jgi:hypothetical protein
MYSKKEDKLQEEFIALLKERIPNHLINRLMDILPLEKEAVYRRLRGNVPFSFFEIATLSAYLGLSLDPIVNTISPYRSQLYQLHVRNYSEFTPVDLNMSLNYINAINMAAESPRSEFGIAANMLPLHISLLHLPIYRIYILKWRYQFGTAPRNLLSYSGIQVPEEEEETYSGYLEAVKRIKYTFFIWDSSFLTSLINDVNYFFSIRIINREEMDMLRQEMFNMLDTLEYYVNEGQFTETGNKVETYVSNLNFGTTYSYLCSDNLSISMSSAYSLGAFTSLEREACKEMKKWVAGLKKSSNLISGAALQDKIRFFDKQRDLLEKNLL